ncbi:hypothetical protein MMPV_005643 [Pyropia vietnamensis]
MVHDGCVGASYVSATSPLATIDTAPTPIATGGAAPKAFAAPLPPGGARISNPSPGVLLRPQSLEPPHGAVSGVCDRDARLGNCGDDRRDDDGPLPEVRAATPSSDGLPTGRVGSALSGAPHGGAAATRLPPLAPGTPPPPDVAMTSSGGNRGSRGRGDGCGRRRGLGRDGTSLSRRLSRLLRHDLLAAGLVPAPDGYVPLAAVLRCRGFSGVTVDAVCACVASNEKQRFSLVRRPPLGSDGGPTNGPHAGDGELHIRANQGFSAVVAAFLCADAVYTRLVPPAAGSPPLLGVHATTPAAFARIAADEGLRAMRRDAIHFSPLSPPASPSSPSLMGSSLPEPRAELDVLRGVVAGLRSNRRQDGQLDDRIALVVDVGASAAAGVVWYMSSNRVLLTQGGEGGVLAKRWIVRVTDVTSGADRTADLWAAPSGGTCGRA